jgi:isopenicillin N synthase-like dioxygenase
MQEADEMATTADGEQAGTVTTDPLAARAVPFDDIPIIDFGGMLGSDPVAMRGVAGAVRAACERVGFFYIRNHGISEETLARTFEAARRFFAMQLPEKLLVHKRESAYHAGYTPMLEENTDPANVGDLHECFDMVSQLARGASEQAPGSDVNLWPASLPEFRIQLGRYFDEIYQLGRRLFEVVELSLDLPVGFFRPYLTRPTAMLRLNYYPPQPPQGNASQIGIGAHTDYECFTILAQEPGITALQVWNGREWIQAPPIPGTFVVNIADQMQRWTNDAFRSTRHRAVNGSGRPRLSIPFFLGVNYETVIAPLPGCVSADRPGKYPPVIAGEYLFERLNATYGGATPR